MTLVLAGSVALAAEFFATGPATPRTSTSATTIASDDIDGFLAPLRHERGLQQFDGLLASDPLADDRAPRDTVRAVARAGGAPTVSPSGRRARRLTAILIADNRPVAVLDEVVVGVGDRLADGARIDAIRSDGVWIVERNGQRRMLTLAPGRQ